MQAITSTKIDESIPYQVISETKAFFFGPVQKIIKCQMCIPPAVEWKTVSDFYWLKTPPAPSVATVFERFPQPWQTVDPVPGPSHCPDSNLKWVGSSSGVTSFLIHLHSHVWWANASQKWTSNFRAQRKPSWPYWSGISLWACQTWVTYGLPVLSRGFRYADYLSDWQRSANAGRNQLQLRMFTELSRNRGM